MQAVSGKAVLVGFSGGVDSTATILLLRRHGFEPIAVTFIFNEFFAIQRTDEIAEKLGVKLIKVDLREKFEKEIIRRFIEEYRSGRTPNVCGICNREFKIRNLVKMAQKMGVRWVATGHYARIHEEHGKRLIKRAKYREKDQSYFLALVRWDDLDYVMFPLGDFKKEWVRDYVHSHGIDIARDEESQDVCFIRGKFREFMAQKVGNRPGPIIGPDGRVIGVHEGIQYYTVGQRRGLEVALGRRVYVGKIEPEENTVVLVEKEDVYRKFMRVSELNWFIEPEERECLVQIRNVHRAAKAMVKLEGNEAVVEFYEPQWAPTPGQIAAFYKDDLLIGGGIIKESWK